MALFTTTVRDPAAVSLGHFAVVSRLASSASASCTFDRTNTNTAFLSTPKILRLPHVCLSTAGDNMAIVVSNWSGTDLAANPWVKRVTLTAISIGAVLPLAMLKNMSALSKTSFISICAVLFIIGVVIKNAITGPGDAPVPVTPEVSIAACGC